MPHGRVIRSDLEPRGREHVTILALDGGGIRGLIPARVLESLEQRAGMPMCGCSTGSPGPPPVASSRRRAILVGRA
jgi:predicted acylesterase/phospholipase RssA